jgi:hypothetical protein
MPKTDLEMLIYDKLRDRGFMPTPGIGGSMSAAWLSRNFGRPYQALPLARLFVTSGVRNEQPPLAAHSRKAVGQQSAQ